VKANLLKIRRWEIGLKQYELAEMLNCSAPYLSMVENERLDPPEDFKRKVAMVLKVKVNEVFPIGHEAGFSYSSQKIRQLEPGAKTMSRRIKV
jgi:DNA-binding XRE family transcriptional regulator